MKNKYGHYSQSQILSIKKSIQKTIFFLLLCVDPETAGEYSDINVVDVFVNLQYKLNGLNNILL